MQDYLEQFFKGISSWKGSLFKVEHVEEPYAKEYLGKLVKAGLVERVSWGWYWIPGKAGTFWDFLRGDRNFKAIAGQTAASFWNNDFIHRDVYVVKVKDSSYGKALVAFAKARGWAVVVELVKEDDTYVKSDGVYVEAIEDCVIGCMQRWAFADAFAVLYENRKKSLYPCLAEKSYWKRISKSDVRVRQALSYGLGRLNVLARQDIFPVGRTSLGDSFVVKEIDEAVEKVVDLG